MYFKRKILSVFFLSFLFISPACSNKNDNAQEDIEDEKKELVETQNHKSEISNSGEGTVRSIKVRNIGPLYEVFNDSNYLQLEAARRLGIEPIDDLSKSYFMSRPLVKIESNEFYQVDSLSHSLPYLVPEAAALLEDIGKNFIDSLHSRGGDNYKIKVTSVLRTPATVRSLRKINVNATDSSTHQYATTFDISYSNFYCFDPNRQINQGDLKNLLGEVLLDLKNQGRCLVKFENKTACFHVTVDK